MLAPCTLNPGNQAASSSQQDSMSTPWYPPPGPSYNFIMDAPPSNSREQRNRAEKHRRDKLNSFISDLATMVPQVARSAKRMDKTSVLRLTATNLRVENMILRPMRMRSQQMKENNIIEASTFPTWVKVDGTVLDDMVREQLTGFLTVMTNTGKVILLSPSVENLLGHTQVDLLGHDIFHILAPEDHERMRKCLENVYYSSGAEIQVRMRRAGPRTESPIYEICQMRIVNSGLLNEDESSNYEDSSCREIAHANALPARTYTCFIRVHKHEVNNRVLSIISEYITRHLIDGRIISCDQRISCIAGYLSEEVSGLSAFKFMHRDDVRWVMIALRQMYDRGDSRGTSCYRLMSRTGRFIYLRTSGYLEVDKDGIVESFVCINQAVCESEGVKLISEMKRKFSANLNVVSESEESSVESVEDPEYVEAAVIHLITNLPSPGSDHRSTPSPRHASLSENQDCPTTESIIKPYHIQIKTAPKRPPSTEQDANLYKRQRTSPQSLSPIPSTSSASPYDMMSHSSSSQIMDIPELDLDEKQTQSKQSIYQHDQLLHHHV